MRPAWSDGMILRSGTSDETVIDEVKEYLPLGIQPGDVVLDVGAHIGCFARMALHEGASKVICVEPEGENFSYLERNVIGQTLIRAALSREQLVELYVNQGRGTSTHTVFPVTGREKVVVPGVTLAYLDVHYRPQRVKIDCEGAELQVGLDSYVFSDLVRGLSIEFHVATGRRSCVEEEREEAMHAIIANVEGQGFVPFKSYDLKAQRTYFGNNLRYYVVTWNR